MQSTYYDYNAKLSGILASARMALRTTFRDRAHLPGCAWCAFLGNGNGIIVARTDDPESPPMPHWVQVCRINNARSDDQNMTAIEASLRTIPRPD